MEKLLIVEDEKLIRQGLRTIIQRSGVPVEEILESRNGLEALELLKRVAVDVVFTDVRMPKMDGITLIRKIQEELEPPRPEVVVISGHDDFNYAVEAMRYGSQEYILKPVERDRVRQVLEKMESLVADKMKIRTAREAMGQISKQQLKYILLNPKIGEDEIAMIKNAFQDLLAFGSYVVLCLNKRVEIPEEETAFQLENVGISSNLIVLPDTRYQEFIQRCLQDCYVGVSNPHKELDDFREAFEEAVQARKYAYITGKRAACREQVFYLEETIRQQFSPEQLARRLGAREYVELVRFLDGLFNQAARGRLYPHIFEGFQLGLLNAIGEIFGRLMTAGEQERMEQLKMMYDYDSIDAYRLAFLEWLDKLHAKVFAEMESFHNREKIKEALEYVHMHYDTSLNMAVVSNQISMNYSVFSQLFKEYTGKNFVDYLRDLRIEKARALLADTDRKISEISRTVGYEDDKYFMKTFKAVMGVSPTQFRKTEQMKRRGLSQ